jgi:FAD/FMN-containing dehydrogenase
MDADHKIAVEGIAVQVRDFYRRGEGFKIYHGHTNSTRVLEFDRSRMVDVRGLDRVLRVDSHRRVAVVEANVPMDALVKATLPFGLVPPVVMEFPGITVAGGLQGGAGESSSFKWGGFNEILNWFEIVLGNGEVARASPGQRADLFYGAMGAYGTLGVVTAAEVQLVKAGAFVELEYLPVSSFEQAARVVAEQVELQPDFVDGILFASNRGVIITGRLTDATKRKVVRFTRPWDDWFYTHAEQRVRAGRPAGDAVPLYDYLFRYERGAFWMGRYAFRKLGWPFNAITRSLLNPIMHTRKLYEALQASGVSQMFTIQDMAVPPERAVEFLEYIDRKFGIYPLWLCPLNIQGHDGQSQLLSRPLLDGQALNVGVWGFQSHDLDKVEAANRELEDMVWQVRGRKWLYAYAYYTEEQFWQIFDRQWYESLRQKYGAATLPSVYDKVCRARRYPVDIGRGVLVALSGRRGIRFSKRTGE